MYIQTYHSICKDRLRVQIDMTRVEALLERASGTQIVTSSDTYTVAEAFDEVEAA
jgi:hypothetical protein